LSDRERVMFSLRLVEGLTLREIGERFGVGPERARQLIVRYCHATGVPLPTRRRGRPSKCAGGPDRMKIEGGGEFAADDIRA
jgi:transposase